MYENEITKKMLHGNTNILIEPSFVQIENLIDGRVSYRGMNPEIERLMELETQGTALLRATAEVDELRKMKTDVTDSDMLKFYSNLDNTMQKKFVSKPKRQRPADQAAQLFHAKKGKFMKPRDED
jgi:M-phase phosphoprotein 6, animal type